MTKPPYEIPTLAEIAALPKNGFKVVSTFSGGGGSSTGYAMAGFTVLWANEFIKAAQETYQANHKSCILDPRDIRTIQPNEILAAIGLCVGQLDLLDGSPPCSAFSTAGKREKGWGQSKSYSDDANQVGDDLFFEYTRLVRGLQPKVFIAENVSGLVKGTSKGYFLNILRELKDCGYQVNARLLNAAWLGVPQARERLIFIGVRNDLNRQPIFPKPLPYQYTLRDALPWILATRVVNVKAEIPAVEADAWMTGKATGTEWANVPVGGQSEKYFQLTRPCPNKPVGTITASGGNSGLASVAHPYECRKFSIGELKRVSSFPDDYVLTGSYTQQWERVGRSVPPVMMKNIAATVRDEILSKL